MVNAVPSDEGHVFISYVREDAAKVDRLQTVLEGAGVTVWRDTDRLWPGEDWRLRIRQAITDGAFAFLACFSEQSAAKPASYQREELLLAIEQFRLRPPDVPWLIPVRFDDVELPSYDIGAARTLSSLNWVDLLDTTWDTGAARLVAGVLRVVGGAAIPHPTESGAATDRMKRLLLDPAHQIELEDLVMAESNRIHIELASDDWFPTRSDQLTNDIAGQRYLAAQAHRYLEVVQPLVELVVVGAAWGRPEHNALWKRAVERVVNLGGVEGGQSALVSLRRLPLLPLLYGVGLVAHQRERYGVLKAVAIDARYRTNRSETMPVVAAAHPWRPFEQAELAANFLALETAGVEVTDEVAQQLKSGRKGKRHTPVTDMLHDLLRPILEPLIPDETTYTETFDELDVLLAVLAEDQKTQLSGTGPYVDGAWFGSFTWRDRYFNSVPIERRMAQQLDALGSTAPMLEAGLFGASPERAAEAFGGFFPGAEAARHNRF